MEKVTFTYVNDSGINVSIEVPEDVNLTQLVAYVVELTRIVGYQAGSWENVIDNLNEYKFDSRSDIFEWATDTICDMRLEY